MTIVKHCRRALVSVLGLVLLLVPAAQPPAADGIGRVDVTPARVAAGSTGTFTLVFVADAGDLNGQAVLDIPRGWSPPQTTKPGALGFVGFARGSCRRGQRFTITYGPATASTMAADGYVFLTQTRPKVAFATKTVRRIVKTKKGKRKTKVTR